MVRRVALFLALNFLVVLTLSAVLGLLGLGTGAGRDGGSMAGLMVFCLVWGMGGALISLALSRVMAKHAMGVRLVAAGSADPQEAWLQRTVARLAARAGLPRTPEVGIYPSPEVNAFATGPTRARALVAVSTGLLARLDERAVEGVIGHELAHVTNGDMVTMTLLQGVVNAFAMFLSRAVAFAVRQGTRDAAGERRQGSPWLAAVIQMALEAVFMLAGSLLVAAFSRRREYRADRGGAELAGANAMIGALEALAHNHRDGAATGREAAVATLMIDGKPSGLLALFASHPPLSDRIARLRARPFHV